MKGEHIFMPGLCLLFIGLKLGGVIDWSWWWVLSPLWIALLVTFVIFALAELRKSRSRSDLKTLQEVMRQRSKK